LYNLPFVGTAPDVLVAAGDAAAALELLASIELIAEAATEDAADAAREEASGRLGAVEMLMLPFSEMPCS
jgi:hypothetical protein